MTKNKRITENNTTPFLYCTVNVYVVIHFCERHF